MMLPNFVNTALKEISETLSYNKDLDKAVEAWCNKLEFKHNETVEIKKTVQELLKLRIDNKNNDMINFCNRIILFVDIPNNFLEAMKNINFQTFLLIVLGLVVSAFIIIRIKPSQKEEAKTLKNKQYKALPPQIETHEHSQVLVLVINATCLNKLECLHSNLKIMLSDAEELYKSTRALWIGTKFEYLRSPIKNIFDNKYQLLQREESDFDVCFVKIELKENHPGFEFNANPMDKLDAFKMLSKIAIKVNASHRLPSKYYQNTGVYLL